MLFSTRTGYSIRALYELARNYGSGPISISYMSEKQKIPETYLEQLLYILKGSDIVEGVRGVNGGYILTKAPKDVNLADILKLTEGKNNIMKCMQGEDKCLIRDVCPAHDILNDIQVSVYNVLAAISLQDIVDKNNLSSKGDPSVDENILRSLGNDAG